MDAVTSPTRSDLPPDVWRELAEHFPQLAWIADDAGSIRWANSRWCDFSGLSQAELLEQGWRALLISQERDEVDASVAEAIRTRQPWEMTIRLRGQDGNYRRFLGRAQPMFGEDGAILYWFGTATDLESGVIPEPPAQRHRAFLLRLEETLRVCSDTATVKLAAARLLGEEIGASRVVYAESSEGTDLRIEEEFLADGISSIRGVHIVPSAIADLYARGAPIITADFRSDPALASARDHPAVRDMPVTAIIDVPLLRDGKLVGVLMAHDVAKREWSDAEIALAVATAERTWDTVARARVEEQLRFSEAQFRSTAEAMPGMLFVTDALGNNLYVNGYFKAYAGLTDEDVQGDGWAAIVHPDDLPSVRAASERAIAAGETAELDYRLRRHDGVYRWHSTRATPIRQDGMVARWVGVSLDIHDRRTAAEQIRLTADEISATYATAPIGLAVLDRDLRYVRINERLAAMNGLAAADHIGRTLQDVVPAIGKPLQEAIRRVFDGEEIWGFEVSGETASAPGAVRTWRENWLPLRDADGNITGAAGSVEEITGQKEAESALALSEERLRLATSGADVGIWELDFTTGRGLWSEDSRRLMGMDFHTFGMDDWAVSVHPDDRERIVAAWKRAIEEQAPYEIEVRTARPAPDGSERWVTTRGVIERDSEGRPLTARGVIFDITARRQAEQLRGEAEDRYRTVINSAAVGIARVGPDGAFLEVNDRLCEIVDRSREDILGGGWRDITHPDDIAGDQRLVEQILRGEIDSYTYEKRYLTPDRSEVWVNLSVSTERNLDGSVRFFISVIEDITERKAVEAALRASEERLRIATEHAEVGFWDVDEANGELTWPPLVKRLFGILPDQTVTMDDFYKGLHPDDFDAVAAAYAAAADPARRALYDIEYRTVGRDDGIVRWVAAKGRGLFSDDGKCLRVVGTVVDITARKEAEEALRESEERYRTLFESMDQGFCIIQVTFDGERAVDYRFNEINPAFTRQSGLAQTVVGKSISEVIPDLEQSWKDRYGRIARTGSHERFIEHAAALGRWFEVFAFPIGKRELCSVAVLFTDVTERVEREESLRQSEGELRLRLNAIPQMVWSTLPDGYHDFYNDRWYEFTGVPHGTTDGEAWNGVFHPDDQPLAWERWKSALESGAPYEIEYRLRHHSGGYRWVLGRALPIRDDSGAIVRWMGTCTDIDDRVEADRALQASEARLRAILEAVPVGLMFSDADGRLTGSNQQIIDFLGGELVGSSRIEDYEQDYVAFHADGRQVKSEEYPLARALRGEERPELECQVQRGDGSLRWLRYVAAPIRSSPGEITGGVVASIDIDRERRLTLGLEREVEKVVAEREAAQEALRQSQKLEAMGQLTGGVAHDFNNLLTPIIGSLDLLQRKQVLDDRTGRLVDGALASAERARVLVQRLLAFARRQPLQPQPIDVARIVAEMSELIASTSGPRVRVRTETPDHVPPALADGNQLEMALLNLSVNARDAMPDGGTLTIAIRCEREGAGVRLGLGQGAHVVLGVSDTGVGMDEETRRRAIEPFFSTKGIGKGTGLGLSMVHGLAAQLGGALDIRSAPGIGTTIELWLPVAKDAVAAGLAEAGDGDRQGAGTVLLVDDEELVRASTAGMLTDLGYRVVEAESGEEALARVREGTRPDFLVTDQLMPGLSGTDLAVRLRETLPNLPVLVVSGYADLDSLSPAFPHLSKPFRQVELSAALEKVVGD